MDSEDDSSFIDYYEVLNVAEDAASAEIAAAFEEFADRHGESVWEEVLAPMREGRREPTWRPTGFMEGLGFQAQISKILRERFDLSQHHGQK